MSEKGDKVMNKKDEKKTTITFNISVENKKALKVYAAEHEITISALMTKWIEENCKGTKKK